MKAFSFTVTRRGGWTCTIPDGLVRAEETDQVTIVIETRREAELPKPKESR